MKEYTVLLLYPDYMSENYGQETYMTSVTAEDVTQAVGKAREQAWMDNKMGPDDDGNAEDFFVLCVIAGNHQDIKEAA